MSLPTFKVYAWGRRLILFATIFAGLYCFKLWQPKRQIELHQKNFLLALEDRKWSRVKGHFSADYKDRFGHTRETALGNLKDVLRHFFVLSIRSQGSQMQLTHDTATITTNLTLTGTGSAATEWITQEVNRLPTPWTFTWQKASFWPWDWQLTNVDNEGLVIPSGTVF